MGLLGERKLTAQQRAESLREEADQLLAAPEGPEPSPEPAESDRAVGRRTGPARRRRPVSVAPFWSEGLHHLSTLPVDCQRILTVPADRERTSDEGALACTEFVGALDLSQTPAKIEGVRSKANRLVGREWPGKDASERFALADGVVPSGRTPSPVAVFGGGGGLGQMSGPAPGQPYAQCRRARAHRLARAFGPGDRSERRVGRRAVLLSARRPLLPHPARSWP